MSTLRLLTLGLLLGASTLVTRPLSSQQIITPATGSAPRRAILDAVRSHLGTESRFQVQHLKMNDRWAYIRAGEVASADGTLQETDLSIAALLEHRAGRWNVVELWSLPGEGYFSFAEFTRLVRDRQAQDHIPATLFPPEL